MNTGGVFSAYSAYYDLFYKDKNYEGEVKYLIDLANGPTGKIKTILELGCGTGGHAVHLAELGYSVTGIDISKTMLSQADDRKLGMTEDLSSQLDFTVGDIRNYRGDKKFDCVMSLFHVFSYQTSNLDLKKSIRTAWENLERGGVLIFDYWYGPAVISQLPESRTKEMENETYHVFRSASPKIDLNNNTVKVEYAITVNNKESGEREEISESHEMRYLFIPELLLLTEEYFEPIGHYGWGGKLSPSVDDWAAVSMWKKI